MIVIKVLSIIFIMVGFLLLGLSGPVFQTRADFINTAASTKGVVTEIVRRASTSRLGIFTHYSYKIAYQAGQEYFEAVTAESHSSPEYEVGQTVTVLYDRQHPNQATLDDFSMLWVDFGLLVVSGVCFLGVGLCNLWITASPAPKIRTAVSLKELAVAWRGGRLTRNSEYQGILVAFTFVGFALLGAITLAILFATTTAKVVLVSMGFYALVQIWRGRRNRPKNNLP